MKNLSLSKLAVCIGLCLGIGVIGSFFTTSAISTWYVTLNRPVFTPPNWVFGPVWTFLYILMGVSLYLVWQHGAKHKAVERGFVFFGLQLFLNLLWSILFFGFQSPLLALIDIVVLLMVLIVTLLTFKQVSKPAFYLLLPYFMWVSFASLLNASIFILN